MKDQDMILIYFWIISAIGIISFSIYQIKNSKDNESFKDALLLLLLGIFPFSAILIGGLAIGFGFVIGFYYIFEYIGNHLFKKFKK